MWCQCSRTSAHTRTEKAQIEGMKAPKLKTKFTAKFSRALDMRDTKVLRSMAYAMTDFNGGACLVQVYTQTKTSEAQLSQGHQQQVGKQKKGTYLGPLQSVCSRRRWSAECRTSTGRSSTKYDQRQRS